LIKFISLVFPKISVFTNAIGRIAVGGASGVGEASGWTGPAWVGEACRDGVGACVDPTGRVGVGPVERGESRLQLIVMAVKIIAMNPKVLAVDLGEGFMLVLSLKVHLRR
jgi:hypothetical protein